MPLGYCMECKCLKPIVKLGLKWGSRQCEWAPVEHDQPDTHTCGEVVDWNERACEDSRQLECVPICRKCDVVELEAVIQGSGRCSGSRKAIK